jgi:hypothetical protein
MITHCATTKEITPLRARFWALGGQLRLRHDRRLFDIKDGDRLPIASWRSQNGLPGTTAMIGAEQTRAGKEGADDEIRCTSARRERRGDWKTPDVRTEGDVL